MIRVSAKWQTPFVMMPGIGPIYKPQHFQHSFAPNIEAWLLAQGYLEDVAQDEKPVEAPVAKAAKAGKADKADKSESVPTPPPEAPAPEVEAEVEESSPAPSETLLANQVITADTVKLESTGETEEKAEESTVTQRSRKRGKTEGA